MTQDLNVPPQDPWVTERKIEIYNDVVHISETIDTQHPKCPFIVPPWANPLQREIPRYVWRLCNYPLDEAAELFGAPDHATR
jgi:hypothetical protein